jgi:hypothetical protein
MVHAWQEGVLIPRWSANLGKGYGMPIFVYGAPLTYLLTAFWHNMGLAFESAFKATLLTGALLAVYGAYLLTRTVGGRLAGAVGAAAFLYAPIFLREFFIQGNTPQLLAWSLAPWAAWATVQLFASAPGGRDEEPTAAGLTPPQPSPVKGGGRWLDSLGSRSSVSFLYEESAHGEPVSTPLENERTVRGQPLPPPGRGRPGGGNRALLQKLQAAIVLTLALASALISHNAAALIMMGMVCSLGLLLGLLTKRWFSLFAMWVCAVAGLSLSAWFWAPALLEGKYVQLERIVASDFRPRLIPLRELLALSPPLDQGAINPYFPITWGAVQVWLGGVGVLLFVLWLWQQRAIRWHRQGVHLRLPTFVTYFFLLFTFFCGFMATPWSEPAWTLLPFASLFQWPFRWHGFTALGLSWLCAFAVATVGRLYPSVILFSAEPINAGVSQLGDRSSIPGKDEEASPHTTPGSPFPGMRWLRRQWSSDPHLERETTDAPPWAGSLALLLLIGSALVNLYPDKLPIGSYGLSPAAVVRYEERSGTVGTTSLGEFDPIWTGNGLGNLPTPAEYELGLPVQRLPEPLPEGVSGRHDFSSIHEHRFRLELTKPTTIIFKLLYFPGWQAQVDGQPAIPQPAPESGLLSLTLPAGKHQVTLTFGETPLRRWADMVSLAAWSALLMFVIRRLWRAQNRITHYKEAKRQRTAGDWVASWRLHGWIHGGESVQALLSVLVSALGASALLWLTPGWFQTYTPPGQAPAGLQPPQVGFGDQLRLLGIDPPPNVVEAGDPVTVVTYWRALQPLVTDYAIFLHLDTPAGQTVAAVDYQHPAEIPTTDWSPSLYVRAPLRLPVPDHLPPIRYRLMVGLVDGKTGEWLSPNSPGDVVELGLLWVTPRHPPAPPAGPSVRFGEAIHLLGVRRDAAGGTVTLIWQTTAAIPKDYMVFVHVLDGQGVKLGQIDAAPFDNQYPTSAWRVEQVIEDVRSLSQLAPQPAAIGKLLIGLYDPATGQRLTALDAAGNPLPDNALLLDLARLLP